MEKKKPLTYAYWAVLILVTIAGLVGLGNRVAVGLRSTAMGSLIAWGLWLALYIYFIGLSAGAFLISSLVYAFGVERYRRAGRLALFTALACLITALLFVWIDLGRMDRFWELFVRADFHSVLTWVIWLYAIYLILLSVELWLEMRQDLIRWQGKPGLVGALCRFLAFGSQDLSPDSRRRDLRVVKVLGSIGVPLAVMFHGGVGTVFGVVAARPVWHTGLYPLLFLVSALASGGALLTFIAAFFAPDRGTEAHRRLVTDLGQLTLGLVLLDALFTLSEYLITFYGGIPGHVSPLQNVLSGPFWWVFWAGQVVLGFVVPVVLLGLLGTRRSSTWVGLAAASVVLAFVSVRLNIVIPSLSVPEMKGLELAFVHPRISSFYFPSGTEWLATIGVIGLGLLFFSLGFSLLPLQPRSAEE